MQQLITSLLISTIFVGTSGTAFATEDKTLVLKSEDNPSMKRYTIEVRPIETLASSVPGVAAGGISSEVNISKQWALAIGGSYADINSLPRKFVTTTNEDKGSPMFDNGFGYSLGASLRYYNVPIGDSSYGGLNLDYGETHLRWGFREETYKTDQTALTPSLVAGYRWVWLKGFLMRLGVGAGLPSVASQKIVDKTRGKDVDEGHKKIEDILNQKVALKLDLGVGMMF